MSDRPLSVSASNSTTTDSDRWSTEFGRLRAAVMNRRAWKITGVYAVVAVLWIYFSDKALGIIFQDPDLILRWSVYKGVVFVLCTALLIQFLIGRTFQALEVSAEVLRTQAGQLASLNRSLEAQVADRTSELKEALDQAQSADRMKSAFLATMSHELRTPLNSIIGFTGIVVQGLAGELNDEQRKQLGMVQTSARHLLDLINDVLDLSKIEAGQLPIQPETFEVAASVEKVANLMQPLIERKGLEFEVDVGPGIGAMFSDQRRFEQILLNLLGNAAKFTDTGKVVLSVSADQGFRPKGKTSAVDAVRVTVADTGIGIKDSHLKQLFQPFVQLDSGLTRQHEGTGLGLAICERLAVLLEGEISVNSERGRGSVFTVVLTRQLSGKHE
ncbi:MAG: hypothetical protein JJU20_04820 [Opitutales bacterium]|nr:hypothetical protein [Opitutales bacterium]